LRLIAKAALPDPKDRVVVLCYHSVHPSLPFSSATPELFDEHLDWLLQHCDVVPFSGVPTARDNARSRPAVSVTFDDGYSDNHEFALPALVRHGITATFFVTAGFLERDAAVLARFRALRGVSAQMIRPLSWSQLDEMRAAGMDVGAHTYSHPNLARLGDRELDLELTRPKQILEDRTGTSVTMMAYPFGRPKVHVDGRVVVAVRRSGYALAATTATRGLRTRDDPLMFPRFFATRDSVALLREKVLGEWDLIGIVRERAPKTAARFMSPRDFGF
jgi:peptidoglycan/xylan/chitin deacetylase (PgdA/CDA1 family)